MTSLLLITSHYFQLNCFAILLIDDYHYVHAKKVPTKLITSTATHMASCLLDIHPTIPAVPHPQQTPLHRPVKITIKGAEVTCYGGIENRVIQQKMHQALVNMKKPFESALHSNASSKPETVAKSSKTIKASFQKITQTQIFEYMYTR